MWGGGSEAGKGCAGVDLEDIPVEVHCAEYDHRQRGGLKALTVIRRGGLCHQGHCGGAWTSCSPAGCSLRADGCQKD